MTNEARDVAMRLTAARLSENQRDALLFWPKGYADPNTVKSLRKRGLIQGMTLTASGLDVRAILAETPQ